MRNLNKLSLPATILIASLILGGFYFLSQVSKQNSIERQQLAEIEQKKQEQLDKEVKEKKYGEEVKQGLNNCLDEASTKYSNNWGNERETRGLLTERCISLLDMAYSDYVKELPYGKRLDTFDDYLKEKEECSCSLPLTIADRLNDGLDKDKQNCFKIYPQN